MKKILLIDDHPLFLKGIVLILNASLPNCTVTTVDTMVAARQFLEKQLPDLVLLDLMMPDGNGINNLKLLIRDYSALTVSILSSSENKSDIEQSLAFGASGYIPKTSTPDEMVTAINVMLLGNYYYPNHIQDFLPNEIDTRNEYKISPRQLEILSLVSKGLTNKVIAEELFISEGTVKQHLSAIFKIMKVSNRVKAVQVAGKLFDL